MQSRFRRHGGGAEYPLCGIFYCKNSPYRGGGGHGVKSTGQVVFFKPISSGNLLVLPHTFILNVLIDSDPSPHFGGPETVGVMFFSPLPGTWGGDYVAFLVPSLGGTLSAMRA